jgi:broad specificity phosphatase PhoE
LFSDEVSMVAPLVVHVVRHGEVYNPDKILYGRLPHFVLSATGREQAQATGKFLAQRSISAIYASPMERAQETATHISQARPTPMAIQTHNNLNECLTPFQGKPLAELELIQFEVYTNNQPPFEQAQDLRGRAVAFLQEQRRRHAHQEIIAVTHGDIVVTLFMLAVGQSANDIGRGKLEEWGLPERYPATAGVLTLTYHTHDEHEIPAWQYTRPY